MADEQGQVAGRLEVPVHSSTKGFKEKLKRKLEQASKGLAVEVGIDLDAKGLRKDLQKKVKKASAGVTVKVGIDLDAKDLPGKVKAAAAAAEAKVRVTTDASGLVDDVAKDTAKAEAAAEANPVKVPIKAKFGLLLDALAERAKAQAALDRAGPLETGMSVRKPRLRGLLRGGMIVGLLSLIQPAVGAIGQLIGGLTAMVGAMAPAAGTLAALPVGISALITTLLGVTVASQGVGDAMGMLAEKQKAVASGAEWTAEQQDKLDQALKNVSPSARVFAKDLIGLRGEWTAVRKQVQESLFGEFADEVKPLARTLLPTLETGLSRVAAAAGRVAGNTMRWMQTPLFNRNFAGIMEQNARTTEAGGNALRYFFAGYLEFQRAAAPFQRRFDSWMESTGQWFATTMRENRLDGSTAAFLDKAIERARLTWDITKELGGGLAGIFRAGDASGVRLLNTFDSFLTRWHAWVDSTEGQDRISLWFDRVEGGFLETSRMVGDLGVALAKWAEDPKIAEMLHMIRTELGPALNEFLITMSDAMGDNTVTFITELTRAINNMAPAIEVLSGVTSGVLALVGAINSGIEKMGPFGDLLAMVAGGAFLMRKGRKWGLGGKAAAKGGGGLLSGLLGGAAGSLLGGGKGAAAAGKHLDEAAKAGGRFSKVMRSPIGKRAGILGAIFTTIELGGLLEKDLHDFSAAGDKYVANVQQNGKKSAKTIADLKAEFSEGSIADYADDLGINLDRLAESMAKGGKEGGYFRRTLADLKSESGGVKGGLMKSLGILNPLGDTDAFRADVVVRDLEKIISKVEEARKRLREAKPTDIFSGAKGIVGDAARQAQALAEKIKGLPKAVQTQITTPGVVTSIEYVEVLRDQYNLTPKQVVTTLSASGVVKTLADVTKAQRVLNLTPRQMVTLIKSEGVPLLMGQVAALHRRYKLTPKQIVTLLKATGQDFALRDVKALQKQYHLTPKQVLTLLKAEDRASGLANSIKSIYAGIPRVIRTQIIASKQGRMDAQLARAEGGPVFGPGTDTSDSIPAWLSNNEFVIRAKSVKKYGLAMMRAINAGKFAEGGLVGRFKEGGRVKGGAWVEGLVGALSGDLWQIQKAQATLAEKTGRRYEHQFKRFEALAHRRDRIMERLAGAVTKGQAKEVRSGLIEQGKTFGSLTGIAGGNSGYLAGGYTISELQRRLGQTNDFRGSLGKLRKMGLNGQALADLAAAGVESGLPLVTQLLKASPKQIRQINSLQGQIRTATRRLGNQTHDELMKAGNYAGDGLVGGLRKKQSALTKAAKHLAKSFVKQMKKSLKIKSPSRVMAEIGGFTAEGLAVGIDGRRGKVMEQARRLSADMARALTPSDLYGSSRQVANLRASRTGDLHAAGSGNQAPLVGELVIQGKTKEETQDALEQAMFALRRIRQGGVHAERTA